MSCLDREIFAVWTLDVQIFSCFVQNHSSCEGHPVIICGIQARSSFLLKKDLFPLKVSITNWNDFSCYLLFLFTCTWNQDISCLSAVCKIKSASTAIRSVNFYHILEHCIDFIDTYKWQLKRYIDAEILQRSWNLFQEPTARSYW